ncbi:hypothetical protein HCU74_16610 [Spongiibacter sp. KMU-166]|uniref:Phage abortive infection protein n=1 Tax=Spongiibacter thalassae TaxID=2721624 RepID=A0ABX1GL01_9GAMM|nr:hypothetical protein [Spongiibacter thalassae]NKI19032.1 hypothetical protein [Spongiibacter thalassae]
MKHIGALKPDRLVDLLNWIGIPLALLYIASMFVYPWFDKGWDWGLVQNVWDRWQSLNVGMLAFVSSIIAFNIARFNANKQRERDFQATKAFLPAALAELLDYLKLSAAALVEGWDANGTQPLSTEAPMLPDEYKEIFQQCIRCAKPDVGDYLSKILVRLQIHNSRIRGYVENYKSSELADPDRHNILTYLYRLGELQALIGKLFGFARNEEEFNNAPLEWEDFRNAFGNLDIWVEDYRIDETMNLEDFTKRAIARSENT